jgi:hypothetical protein
VQFCGPVQAEQVAVQEEQAVKLAKVCGGQFATHCPLKK